MSDRPEQPAYQQVAEDLRSRIRNGDPAVGDQLPSLATLMERYSVSITVVRSALRELRSEGIVSSRQGKGTFVKALPDTRTEPASAVEFETIMRHLNQVQDQLRTMEQRLTRLEQSVEMLQAAEGRTPQSGKSRPPAAP